MRSPKSDKIIEIASYILLSLYSFIILSPVIWIFLTSLKSLNEIFSWPPTILPKNPTLINYHEVIERYGFVTCILNSSYIAGITSLVVVTSGVLCAYGLTFFRYKGSSQVAYAILFSRLAPPIALLVPLFLIFREMGLVNTRESLIVYTFFMSFPFIMWCLIGFFRKFPKDLIDAAMVDGCSRIDVLLKVVLPLSKGPLAALAAIAFLWSWNEFMGALVLIRSRGLMPITLGFFTFTQEEYTNWGDLCAAGIMTLIPTIIVFMILQRHMVKGIFSGALRG